LKSVDETEFWSVLDAEQRELLRRTLNKSSLAFVKEEIVVESARGWNAVSIWKRVEMRMPATTNSLEATHKDLNETGSRQSPFWSSLPILCNTIADKPMHFDTALAHNFRTTLKRCSRRSRYLSSERMREECPFFRSISRGMLMRGHSMQDINKSAG
jgi:hypothetical protein